MASAKNTGVCITLDSVERTVKLKQGVALCDLWLSLPVFCSKCRFLANSQTSDIIVFTWPAHNDATEAVMAQLPYVMSLRPAATYFAGVLPST